MSDWEETNPLSRDGTDDLMPPRVVSFKVDIRYPEMVADLLLSGSQRFGRHSLSSLQCPLLGVEAALRRASRRAR